MNEYKFINAESMRIAITELLKAEIKKIHFPPEFVESELTEGWLHRYVSDRIEDANLEMDIDLDVAYEPTTTAFYRIDVDYNKHITGVAERDEKQFQDLVNRINNEDHHAQTKSDLEFLGKWYLDNFAKHDIIDPFVSFVKEWADEWA